MISRFLLAAFSCRFHCCRRCTDRRRERPKITGISHLAVYTSDPAATDHYYRDIIGAAKEPDPENPQGVRYMSARRSIIEVLPLPPGAGINRLDHAACNTANAEGMREVSRREGLEDAGDGDEGLRRQPLVCGARSGGQQG